MTRWDNLSAEDRAVLDHTPSTSARCACGEPLGTEGAVARHFVIEDPKRPRTGWCPNITTSPRTYVVYDDRTPADYEMAALRYERDAQASRAEDHRQTAWILGFLLIMALLVGWAVSNNHGEPVDPGYDRMDRMEQSAS